MIASAPGKIILFGEHAVVYGKHALVSAINLRCKAEVKKSGEIRIHSKFGTTGLDFEVHPYISFAIKRFSELRDLKGVEVKIESDIPPGSGLGSSAAVTVSTLMALNEEFNAGLSREEICEIARKVEIDVQGRASGIDPFISTFGGSWLFPDMEKFLVPYSFFVIYVGEKSTSEMVSKVAKLKEKYPEVMEGIFNAIDSISIEAYRRINDPKSVKDLISINQSLLRGIGVSTPEIDYLISKLEEEGIVAKITGAGGGGCIFGIYEGKIPKNAFIIKPELEGAKIEDT